MDKKLLIQIKKNYLKSFPKLNMKDSNITYQDDMYTQEFGIASKYLFQFPNIQYKNKYV